MILAFVLLAFMSLIEANEYSSHPPCIFNPLCSCSRSDSNLGDVVCEHVPLAKLPTSFNHSKINSLRLTNNGLRQIDSYILSSTGLHIMKISGNPLYDIETDALKGLEISLRDLELSYVDLIHIPSNAFKGLQRLQILNLSGNNIADVSWEKWVHLGDTLEVLILRANAIRYVAAGAFQRFTKLRLLDLSANILVGLDADAFFSQGTLGTGSLSHLYLADNQLTHVPYVQLRSARLLKMLDLDYNLIENLDAIPDTLATIPFDSKLSLHSLHLRHNRIRALTAAHFRRFSAIDAVYLAGNSIQRVQFGTFDRIRIRHLSLANCGLYEFDSRMLRGSEETLNELDLSGNNLVSLDSNLFSHFVMLHELRTSGNPISNFSIPDANSGGSLLRLELAGAADISGQLLLRQISRIKSLISIAISNVEIPFTAPHQFVGYGFGVEELSITRANMKSINARSFIHVRGLKMLDLSDNELGEIDENAFTEIGHSLNTLRLSHAFAKDTRILPYIPLKKLISLKLLDISFNSFEELAVSSFHSMYSLQSVRMHDCQIRDLKLGTFQSDIHYNLKEITLSFNQLDVIKSFTFTDLPELTYLNLEENSVRIVETKAFNNLNKLRWLHLRGNRLETIEPLAFSNLPELQFLDLTFNNLNKFDLTVLDEIVGSSTFLNLNLSFNQIYRLFAKYLDTEAETLMNLNVKVLDLSHNYIMEIDENYFAPLKNALTKLDLSHNRLRNASRAVFGSLSQLQWLDLSFNNIGRVDGDVFREADEIQILNLRSNDLHDLPPNLFHGMKNLRWLDLANNKLNFLSEYSFREDSLESVSLAGNRFTRIPFKSFTAMVATSLREFDLSANSIDSLFSPEFRSAAIFKSLVHLNVSANIISRLDSHIFLELSNLLSLDLSHNPLLQFAEQPSTFNHLKENLRYLSLSNTSTHVPHLPFQKLAILHLSHNNLTTISPEALANLTSVRVLDLSCNNFTSIPVAILPMKNLKVLNLSRNNIRTLLNNSLLGGFEELRELDISYLPFRVFEAGVLSRLASLHTLHMSTCPEIRNLKFAKILKRNYSLRQLHLHISGRTLNEEMEGHFPRNLQQISIRGSDLEDIGSNLLSGFSAPQISFTLTETKVRDLPNDLFRNVDLRVRNISIDVRNNTLTQLRNPSTGISPGLYGHTFLVNLKISQNPWSCQCNIGWVETWSRVKRQIFCRYSNLIWDKSHHRCLQNDDDLRIARCDGQKSLLDAMKFDLECQWSRSAPIVSIGSGLWLSILILTISFHFLRWL